VLARALPCVAGPARRWPAPAPPPPPRAPRPAPAPRPRAPRPAPALSVSIAQLSPLERVNAGSRCCLCRQLAALQPESGQTAAATPPLTPLPPRWPPSASNNHSRNISVARRTRSRYSPQPPGARWSLGRRAPGAQARSSGLNCAFGTVGARRGEAGRDGPGRAGAGRPGAGEGRGGLSGLRRRLSVLGGLARRAGAGLAGCRRRRGGRPSPRGRAASASPKCRARRARSASG